MTDIAATLAAGIAAAQRGNRTEAQKLLTQVVQADDRNEQGWLWLSSVVETSEDAITCLENVLVINPNNQWAREALEIVRVKQVLEGTRSTLPTSTVQTGKTARQLGAFLVEQGFINQEKLNRTLEQQRTLSRRGEKVPLGQLLLRNRYITRDQLARALEQQFSTGEGGARASSISRLGEYLIRNRYISWSQLAQTIALQADMAQQGREVRLGELLVKNNFLTREQLTQALEEQFQDFHSRFGGGRRR